MKRKNLILSLVCSIVLAIGLITFTVISLVPTNQYVDEGNKKPASDIEDEIQPSDKENGDGTVENPYIVDSAEVFNDILVGKYVDSNGDYIDYNEKKDGKFVYPELKEGLNIKLSQDIDFANENFITIFNKGIAFNGTIDGNGFALKNITIEVTKENLAAFMYNDEKNDLGYRAHIGIFGKLDGAKISNLEIENITIKVDESVVKYITEDNTTFVADYKDVMYEISVGLIAGLAFESEIDANVQGVVDASICVPSSNSDVGTNAIGGLVGATVDSDISNSSAKVEIKLNGDGSRYFVGGLVGKAYATKANNVSAETKVIADCDNKVYVGGAFGMVQGIELNAAEIKLNVNELNEPKSDETVADMSSTKADSKINIAGLTAIIDARDASRVAVVKNTKIDADIIIDGVYANAFLEVVSNSKKSVKLVFIENIEISANVKVLKAYGFAKVLKNTEIKTKLALEKVGYDFAITGEVRLNGDEYDCFELIYLSIDDIASTFGENRQYNLTIALGNSLKEKLDTDAILAEGLAKEGRLEFVDEKVEIAFDDEETVA